jgi:hypothetical protein
MMEEFGISERYMKRRNRTLLTAVICSLFAVGILLLMISGGDTERAFFAWIVTVVIFVIIAGIEIPILNLQVRRLKLFIDDEGLIKKRGEKDQIFLWEYITKIIRKERPNGDILFIDLYQGESNPTRLEGFEDMEYIDEVIQDNVNERIEISTKKMLVNWNKPHFVALTTFAVIILVGFVSLGGEVVLNAFFLMFFFGMGIWLIIKNPIAKLMVSPKWIDTGMGLILIIVSVINYTPIIA